MFFRLILLIMITFSLTICLASDEKLTSEQKQIQTRIQVKEKKKLDEIQTDQKKILKKTDEIGGKIQTMQIEQQLMLQILQNMNAEIIKQKTAIPDNGGTQP